MTLFLSLLLLLLPRTVWSGGSGLNVAVVVNRASTNSVQLGNYYAEHRRVPPQNIIPIDWNGGPVSWSLVEFETVLYQPLTNTLAARRLTNQIDFVLLSMDIPYKVTDTNGANSTTSVLFYGFHPDGSQSLNPASCSLPSSSLNQYFATEKPFRLTSPGAQPFRHLTTMITASNLAQAKRIVDQGVRGDGTFPTNAVVLGRSSDPDRNIRAAAYDGAVFDTRVQGNMTMYSIPQDSLYGVIDLLGWQNGLYQYTFSTNAFVPGALADCFTSFGGALFAVNEHTTVLTILNAGAAGSYGTVVEPCAYAEKFPAPRNYFYQARGFALAECYYQSIRNPYQGLLMGDPLSAPFAQPGAGEWTAPLEGATVSGTVGIAARFRAAGSEHPLQQVDLFVDGVKWGTITNVAPAPGNLLELNLANRLLSHTVKPGDTAESIASELAALINQPTNRAELDIVAGALGDRIELQSIHPDRTGAQIVSKTRSRPGSATETTTRIHAGSSLFFDSIARGIRPATVSGEMKSNSHLGLTVTLTNGVSVTVALTNDSAGNTFEQFVRTFVEAVNASPELQGPAGLMIEDVTVRLINAANDTHRSSFNLRARGPGMQNAALQVRLFSSMSATPAMAVALDDNIGDLRPRNHVHVSAGRDELALDFPFDTTTLPDGWHTLTLVACEGTHVRTQTRIDRCVRVNNTPLSATYRTLRGGSNTAEEAVILIEVVANQENIGRMDLFGNGLLLQSATNSRRSQFQLPAAALGPGLHPLHAEVTSTAGTRYRTETKPIRVLPKDHAFTLKMRKSPPTISWPAVAGRSYDVLAADAFLGPFQVRATLISPVDAELIWADTSPSTNGRFYQVRITP